jgi:hypothetical protein
MAISDNTITANLNAKTDPADNSKHFANCFGTTRAFSGTISGDSATLSPLKNDDLLLTITTTIEPGGILLGTYSCAPKTTGSADSGTVYATNVPSISGTWSGTLPGRAGTIYSPAIYPTAVTASIVQSSSASPDNNPPDSYSLSGTVTLENSHCFTSGSSVQTIDPTQSYIAGDEIFITSSSADGSEGFTWGLNSSYPITLDNPTLATAMSNGEASSNSGGKYRYYGNLCDSNRATTGYAVLTKN